MSTDLRTYSISQKIKKAIGLDPGEPKKLSKGSKIFKPAQANASPIYPQPAGGSMKASRAAHVNAKAKPAPKATRRRKNYGSDGGGGFFSGGYDGGGGFFSGGYDGGGGGDCGGGGGGDGGGGGGC